MRVSLRGSRIEVLVDGAAVCAAEDATYDRGRIGLVAATTCPCGSVEVTVEGERR